MNGYGLVLAGGGARGSYEIGVWKALRELDIPIIAVTGTSVGALNGAMVVQGDFNTAYSMWSSLSVGDIIQFQRDIKSISDLYKYPVEMLSAIRNAIISGGLDITPLSNLLHSVIDEEKVRRSTMDFGLVTFSLTDLEAEELFKEDIPEGKLIDYLLASACFPSFKPIEIDNKKFIDGGIYNNLPISLMLKKNIRDLIVVDISQDGLPKDLELSELNIVHIQNSEDLGKILDFNSERSKLNIELGYLDTLKAFDKVKGNNYYLSDIPEKHAKEFVITLSHLEDIYSIIGVKYSDALLPVNKMIIKKIYKLIRKNMQEDIIKEKGSKVSFITAMAEITANHFNIDRRNIYTLQDINKMILDRYTEIINRDDFKEHIDELLLVISNVKEADIIKTLKNMPILMELLPIYLWNPKLRGDDINRLRRIVAMTIPSVSVSSIYMYFLLSNGEKEE
ncbi:MAG TPA: patatin-like phospholipase family protein [Clostridiales bacterium]|nr:patatin-like phospholipase family protein [Clostridiales bacterium]